MVDGGEPGVDSRDEGKHTGRNDLLFVEKMMWMGEDEERVLRGGSTMMRLCRYEDWVVVRTL